MVQVVIDVPPELLDEIDTEGWANNIIIQLLECGDNKLRYFAKKDNLE